MISGIIILSCSKGVRRLAHLGNLPLGLQFVAHDNASVVGYVVAYVSIDFLITDAPIHDED